MLSTETDKKRAVELFEEAFDRLKRGKPLNLPPGTPVSLTNVAKEAGKTPSALRSDRYPQLLQRIKSHMALEREKSELDQKSSAKSRNRTARQRLADCRRQRDHLLSICHSQQTLIDELKDELNRLSEGKEIKFRRGEI